jgi:hypothetical protein
MSTTRAAERQPASGFVSAAHVAGGTKVETSEHTSGSPAQSLLVQFKFCVQGVLSAAAGWQNQPPSGWANVTGR